MGFIFQVHFPVPLTVNVFKTQQLKSLEGSSCLLAGSFNQATSMLQSPLPLEAEPQTLWCSKTQCACLSCPKSNHRLIQISPCFYLYLFQGIYHTLISILINYRYVKSQPLDYFFKIRILFWFIFISIAGFSDALTTVDLLWLSGNCAELLVQKACIWILTLLPTRCMTLTKSLNHPESQFPHWRKKITVSLVWACCGDCDKILDIDLSITNYFEKKNKHVDKYKRKETNNLEEQRDKDQSKLWLTGGWLPQPKFTN